MAATDDAGGLLDRRTPKRGDQRRLALLRALDEKLKVQVLDDINIADLTAAAGVTRSAFYFYFEDKAACVAALGAEMYREVLDATHLLVDGAGSPRDRLEDALRGVFAAWEGHRRLFRAMVTARQRNQSVADLWNTTRASFVEPIAAVIETERANGNAPDGPDSVALATILVELNERAFEQFSADGPPTVEQRVEALVVIWLRSIYGTVAV
ncbi:TetR/AcrR family transcriptional regulator [Nocardia sp. NBC_01377]|uniref:TetR/AcrR family transcriptional regulator n=1 Tax=Nocardia sp. NBC_01377 TaxID=2903595 RepID=UPI0032503E64